jgi:S1/P1 Nuclease
VFQELRQRILGLEFEDADPVLRRASQLTELQSTNTDTWAKKSFEIATKFAYQNGGLTGSPRDGNKDCTTVAAARVLPGGYVVSASRIADRRMIVAGYRLADLLNETFWKLAGS